jgi:hypothetical protein
MLEMYTMNKTAISWIVAGLGFVAYYAMFGRISVQGYDTPPLNFRTMDIVVTAFTMMLFAVAISLVLALFIWRKEKYMKRVSRLLPLSFIGTVTVMIAAIATL